MKVETPARMIDSSDNRPPYAPAGAFASGPVEDGLVRWYTVLQGEEARRRGRSSTAARPQPAAAKAIVAGRFYAVLVASVRALVLLLQRRAICRSGEG